MKVLCKYVYTYCPPVDVGGIVYLKDYSNIVYNGLDGFNNPLGEVRISGYRYIRVHPSTVIPNVFRLELELDILSIDEELLGVGIDFVIYKNIFRSLYISKYP